MLLWKLCAKSGGLLTYHGNDAELTLAGRRILATHYPHYGLGLACTGDYDVVCCGHSHVASVVQQPNVKGGRTWLVNPGTVAGLGRAGDMDARRSRRPSHFEIRANA